MRYLLLLTFLILVPASCSRREAGGLFNREQFRPLYHFTPDSGWMNDPNGLVYLDGEYHLSYQYYPDSTIWGPMHWGHAISNDLIKWQHLPIALFPDSLGYIFSGSAVVDIHNTSNLGDSVHPPMIAIFTYHNPRGNEETQGLAYSTDKGRTWQKYSGNPVLPNPGIRDFRDPKVMWYEPTRQWIMTLAAGDRVQFYSSPDLLNWKAVGEFGKDQGAHGGVWECPDLFPLPVNGNEDTTKWVLLVSINPGAPFGGSGTQYFVGNFDGHRFIWEENEIKWVDYGMDNYAGVTWSNTGKRRLFIGWMSNWVYAQKVPTHPWRSAMTLPRELSLTRNGKSYLLQSAPAAEMEKYQSKIEYDKMKTTPEGPEYYYNRNQLAACRIIVTAHAEVSDKIEITLTNNKGRELKAGFDAVKGELWLDRTRSGLKDFDSNFAAGIHKVHTTTGIKQIRLDLFIDQSSSELFLNNGTYVITDLVFPEEVFNCIKMSSESPFSVYLLQSPD